MSILIKISKTSSADILKIFNIKNSDLSNPLANADDDFSDREIGVIDGVEYTRNHTFVNWGETVKREPVVTFYPKSTEQYRAQLNGLENMEEELDTLATEHSWTNIYCDPNEVMMCMIPYDQSKVPHVAPIESELTTIEYLGPANEYSTYKSKKAFVRVGASVTNEMLRKWGIVNGFSISLNVIMEDITMGGANCTCSHGSSIDQGTVCDLVHAIDIVNSHGNVVTYSKDDVRNGKITQGHFNSVIGSLGLFGVVTSLTLVLDVMTVIQLDPHAAELSLVPRYRSGKSAKDSEYKKDLANFEHMVLDNYYSEFVWFPLQDKLWVNCWNEIDMDPSHPDVEDFPLKTDVTGQKIKSYMMETVDDVLFGILPPIPQAELFGALAMATVPQEKVKTYKSNGIHFQRGIHYWKVRNYEIEIPIHADRNENHERVKSSDGSPIR